MKRKFCQMILKPGSGVAIHQSRATLQFTPTLSYLPGSTVRGAVAQVFIDKRGVADAAFERIFKEYKVHFSDFLPGNRPDLTELPILVPLSAVACKRKQLDHRSSLTDILVNQFLQRTNRAQKCPECGEPLYRIKNKYIVLPEGKTSPDQIDNTLYEAVGHRFSEIKFSEHLRMHVGVSRATGSIVPGLLFSHKLIMPKLEQHCQNSDMDISEIGLYFHGVVSAPDDEAAELFQEIKNVIGLEHLAIGAARTRGQGEFEVEYFKPAGIDAVIDKDEESSATDFASRWVDFNEHFNHYPEYAEKCFFSLTLLSHLVLRNRIGKPILDELSANHLNLPGECRNECAFLNRAVVPGWNAASGLPKPDAVAIGRGSVLLFSAPKFIENELIEQLKTKECEGIGERRAEGFGAVAICNRFHTEFFKE